MTWGRWTIALLAVAAALAAGCGGSDGRGDLVRLPASSCPDPIVQGTAKPDLLIASDLPLQGSSAAQARQMDEAIRFVLRQRDFKAGRRVVGYQACDDSTQQAASWDPERCIANARAYAGNERVAGVIGTLNSPCAKLEVPILNSAGIAMVSPANTDAGLTRTSGVPDEPDRYSPTGTRTYARVIASEQAHGPALAMFARQRLKLRNVFLLDDGTPYGAALAAGFRAEAEKLGLRIAGAREWDRRAAGYGALATAVRASGADGALVAGSLDSHGVVLARDLRAALGPKVPLLAGERFRPAATGAGAAALDGVSIAVSGPSVDRLPEAGKRFVEEFGATQGGAPVRPSSVYAAQAAEVLLDAIAASDGTRPSIVKKLFATKVDDGLMGPFAIDANGDTTAGAVTIIRVDDSHQVAEGAVLPQAP